MAGDGGIGLSSILEKLTTIFRFLISMFQKLPLLPVTITATADAHPINIMPPLQPLATLQPLPSPPLIPLTNTDNSSLRTMQPLAVSSNRTMRPVLPSPTPRPHVPMTMRPPVNTESAHEHPNMQNQQSSPAPLLPLAIPPADEAPQSVEPVPPNSNMQSKQSMPLLPMAITAAAAMDPILQSVEPPLLLPRPVANPPADDSHPIIQILQRFELGKISLTFAATAILGLLYSQKLGGHYKIVIGILSVCVIVWCGMALEKRNPRFGIALQLIGFNLMFSLLCLLIASFLRASLSWASWLLGSLFVIPSLYLLIKLFQPA